MMMNFLLLLILWSIVF